VAYVALVDMDKIFFYYWLTIVAERSLINFYSYCKINL